MRSPLTSAPIWPPAHQIHLYTASRTPHPPPPDTAITITIRKRAQAEPTYGNVILETVVVFPSGPRTDADAETFASLLGRRNYFVYGMAKENKYGDLFGDVAHLESLEPPYKVLPAGSGTAESMVVASALLGTRAWPGAAALPCALGSPAPPGLLTPCAATVTTLITHHRRHASSPAHRCPADHG